MPETTILIFLFPLFYYTISNTPTFLVNDFGIMYNCYIRGVSPTRIIIFELMYDYVAVIAFYGRLLTQAIRIALMFYAYAYMHDYVLYIDCSHL
jgi:hypothetical protein